MSQSNQGNATATSTHAKTVVTEYNKRVDQKIARMVSAKENRQRSKKGIKAVADRIIRSVGLP